MLGRLTHVLATFVAATIIVAAADATPKPVMNGQNFPDPSLIRVGNDYYAYATNGEINGKTVHIQMARSLNDFDHWTFMGDKDGLPTLPKWVDPVSSRVWAPDVVQQNRLRQLHS